MKDFSRSQAITYRKSYSCTAYLIAAIVMTLGVHEGHSLLQAFSSAMFCICGASRGPSASAELLVCIDVDANLCCFCNVCGLC